MNTYHSKHHPSRREYEYRITNLKKIKQAGVGFPSDWNLFVETINKIGGGRPKIVFLYETYKSDMAAYEIGYHRIGTHMVNPSGSLMSWIGKKSDYDGIIEGWRRHGGGEFYL